MDTFLTYFCQVIQKNLILTQSYVADNKVTDVERHHEY